MTIRYEGKVAIVTGAGNGLGKAHALALAERGAKVVVNDLGGARDGTGGSISAAEEVANHINASGGEAIANGANVTKDDDVLEMVQAAVEKWGRVDILINNAGIFKSPINKTKDGLDIRFAVNYFAPFMLTNALLPLLKNGTDARIINLSSAAQSTVRIGALNGEADVNVSEAYAQSKLALTMWSFDLAKRLEKASVIAVNPGSLLNTRMANEAYGQHWSPATKGSDILYELAVSDEYNGITGKYFSTVSPKTKSSTRSES